MERNTQEREPKTATIGKHFPEAGVHKEKRNERDEGSPTCEREQGSDEKREEYESHGEG